MHGFQSRTSLPELGCKRPNGYPNIAQLAVVVGATLLSGQAAGAVDTKEGRAIVRPIPDPDSAGFDSDVTHIRIAPFGTLTSVDRHEPRCSMPHRMRTN